MATRRSKIKAALSKSISSFLQESQKEKSVTVSKCDEGGSISPEVDENGVTLTPNLKPGDGSEQVSISMSTVEAKVEAEVITQQDTVVHKDNKLLDQPNTETETKCFETGSQIEKNFEVPQEMAKEHEKKSRPFLRRKIKPKITSSMLNRTSVAAEPTSLSTVEGSDKEVVVEVIKPEESCQDEKMLDTTKTEAEPVENECLAEENVDVALSAPQEPTEEKCERKCRPAFRKKIKPIFPSNKLERTSKTVAEPTAEPQEHNTVDLENTDCDTSSSTLIEKESVDEKMSIEQDALLQVQNEEQNLDQNSNESVKVELVEVKPVSKPNGLSFRRRIMKPNLITRTAKLENDIETNCESAVSRHEVQMETDSKSDTENAEELQADDETIKLTPKSHVLPFRRRSLTPNITPKNSKSDDEGTSESPSIRSRVPVKPNSKIIVLNNEILEFARSSKPGHGNEESKSDVILTSVGQFGSPNYGFPVPKQLPTDEPRKSEGEYSAPLSPTKLSRPRMRPNPLGLAQRYRHTSASESEEDSRKSYRQRNDSVSSATSTIQDASMSDCLSPQKPKEYNSVIQRKCRRSEQSRKLAEAKQDFALKFGSSKPDRKKLTMIDLIFYNPTTNLMESAMKKNQEATDIGNIDDPTEEEQQQQQEEPEEQSKSGSDEENEIPAPQLKIGPDGQLIIDERSLKVESKSMKKDREKLEKSKVIDDGNVNKGMYKRAKRSKDWNKQETLKFYRALNTIGTDFTLMCELFPRRTRRELKMKFKKEERMNLNLVNRAIMEPCGFDFDLVKHEADMEEKELVEIEKQKQRELQQKKEASKKRKSVMSSNSNSNPAKVPKMEPQKSETEQRKKPKKLDIMDVLDDEDSDDADELNGDSDDDLAEDSILQSMTKPTRSGRVPKIRDRYVAPPIRNQVTQPRTQEREPGSLMVMTTTGPDGKPVYKLFMNNSNGLENLLSISAEINSTVVKNDCGAIQNGKRHIPDESTSITVGENVTISAEENVTIPAEENVTIPAKEDVAIPSKENVAIPAEDNVAIPTEGNVAIPAEENITISADEKILIPTEVNAAIPAGENVTIRVEESPATPMQNHIILSE